MKARLKGSKPLKPPRQFFRVTTGMAKRPGRHPLALALVIGTCLALGGCLTTTPDQQSLSQIAPAAPPPPPAEVSSGDSLARMADSMAAEGAYSAAIPLYRRAYQKSGDARALIGLGRALSASGEYLEAIRALESAGNDNPGALRGMANAYTALGQPAAALPLLDKALGINPVDLDALNSKAVALDLLGRYDEAVSLYERGLEQDPRHAGLSHNYGLALALTETDFTRAIHLLRGVAADQPSTAAERQTLALVYALAGDDAAAGRLLSVDMGSAEAGQRMAYFQLVKSLPVGERFRAVIAANLRPKHDLTAPAVRSFAQDDAAKAAATTRILKETAPLPPLSAAPVAAVETKAEAAPPPAAEKHSSPKAAPSAPLSAGMDEPFPNDWGVQVAAYRYSAQADKGWKILRARYHGILGNLQASQSFIDFGKRDKKPKGKYYRLISGPLKSRAEAVEICRKLHEKGAECMIRGPQSGGQEQP